MQIRTLMSLFAVLINPTAFLVERAQCSDSWDVAECFGDLSVVHMHDESEPQLKTRGHTCGTRSRPAAMRRLWIALSACFRRVGAPLSARPVPLVDCGGWGST